MTVRRSQLTMGTRRARPTRATPGPSPAGRSCADRGERSAHRTLPLAVLFLLALIGTGTAVPWLDNSLEFKVKAGCLYNFARFVTWPEKAFPKADSPIVFGVLGDDPFGKILDATLEGKILGGRRVVLRRSKDASLIDECHMLYVSESEQGRLHELLPRLTASNAFCVSDIEEYALKGGVARFVLRSSKVNFEINVDELEHRKLVVSSQLLKLATVLRYPADRGSH